MNIEESISNLNYLISEYKRTIQLYGDFFIGLQEIEAIETLLTAYEKEKEIIKNAICFLKYYNKDFNKMSDNEIKQILYGFGKCADIKKEE